MPRALLPLLVLAAGLAPIDEAIAQQVDLRTSTTTVLFDVVVRDGRGEPIRDLTLDDFELAEDGVPQALKVLFQRGAPAPARSSSAPGGASPGSAAGAGVTLPIDDPAAVALVFHELSPEARALAARVADALVPRLQDGTWLGVFGLEQSLVEAQPFTTSKQAALEGLRSLALRPAASREPTSGIATSSGRGDLRAGVSPTAAAESEGGVATVAQRTRRLDDAPQQGPEYWLARMEARMVANYDRALRDQQGRTAVDGLRALVSAMARGTARKSLVLFSEGLQTSDQARAMLDTLIATANRAGVTFYAVDAAGLRAHSTLASTGRELEVAGREGLGDVRRNDGAWTKDLERQSDLLRSDGTSTLGRLAKDTGGFLLENSNAVDAMAARLEQDQRAQYVLAYTSSKPALDGTYRKVSVKVKRKGARPTARTGYWAVAVPSDEQPQR